MFVLYYVYKVLLEFYCSVFSREVCRVQDKPSCKSPCLFVPYGFTHYTRTQVDARKRPRQIRSHRTMVYL